MGMGFNIYLQVVFVSIRIFGCRFPLARRSSRINATVPIQHAVIKIKILLPACILKIVSISLLFFQKKQKHAHFHVRHLELYWDARDWALKFHSKHSSNWLLRLGKIFHWCTTNFARNAKKITPFSRRYLITSKVEGVISKVDAFGSFSDAVSSCDQSIMYSNYLNLNSYMCDYWKNGIAVFVKFATIKLLGSKPREK